MGGVGEGRGKATADPCGMTARKATAKARAKARTKATATATAKATAKAKARTSNYKDQYGGPSLRSG